MTYPFVFANESGDQPATQLDTMFNVAGQQGNIPCLTVGTNTITLTPGTNYYVPTSYTDGQMVSFKAAATSTGSVTLQIGGLAFKKVFMPSGIQAASGDIVINTNYLAQFFASLDGGAGGFQITNGTTATAVASPIGGGFKNLRLVTTNDTTLTPTADEVILENSSGGTVRLRSIAPAVTSTASVGTANGIVAAVTASTWYAFWIIYNPNAALSNSNPGGWLDTNFTTPTPPVGYTYYGRFGAFRTETTSKLMRTLQIGRRAQYVVTPATVTASLPQIANSGGGAVGSVTVPTYVAASVAAFVPPSALNIYGAMSGANSGGGETATIVAPNTNYGSIQSTTNPPPVAQNHTAGATFANILEFDFLLESTSIFWASTSTNSQLFCLGWEDNIP